MQLGRLTAKTRSKKRSEATIWGLIKLVTVIHPPKRKTQPAALRSIRRSAHREGVTRRHNQVSH